MVSSKVRLGLFVSFLTIIINFASCIPGLISLKKHSYVPIDLTDCFIQLDTTLAPAVLDTLKNCDRSDNWTP